MNVVIGGCASTPEENASLLEIGSSNIAEVASAVSKALSPKI